LIPTINRII